MSTGERPAAVIHERVNARTGRDETVVTLYHEDDSFDACVFDMQAELSLRRYVEKMRTAGVRILDRTGCFVPWEA